MKNFLFKILSLILLSGIIIFLGICLYKQFNDVYIKIALCEKSSDCTGKMSSPEAAIICYETVINMLLEDIYNRSNPTYAYDIRGQMYGIAADAVEGCNDKLNFSDMKNEKIQIIMDRIAKIQKENKTSFKRGNPFFKNKKYQIKFTEIIRVP